MLAKSWSVLTVRESTALKVKGLAKAQGVTVDQVIDQLISSPSGHRPSQTGQWSVRETCKSKVKTKNLDEHTTRVHPVELTVNPDA